MGRIIDTTIDIEAPATKVWQVLTDFERFPEWSVFILSIEGDVSAGQNIKVRLDNGGGEMMVKPRILVNDAPNELVWRGKMGSSWLFSGEHRFVLKELGNGNTRLSHSEHFTGILVPLLWKTMETKTRSSFKAFNDALRHRVEAAAI